MDDASQVLDPMTEENDSAVMTPDADLDGGVDSPEPQPADETEILDEQTTEESDEVADHEEDAVEEPENAGEAEDAAFASDDASDDVVEIHPRCVVEAILFAADSPMPPAKIAKVLGVGDARDVRKHIDRLNEEYDEQGRAFRIEQIAGGFQMLTVPAFNSWLSKLLKARQETKLTPAAMETLAIIAYKQPCTRADIEAVRGVAAGDIVNRLREMNLVKIVGRAEDLGRPLLYGTTRRFLEVFGLPSLEDLPQVEALSVGGKAKPQKEEAEVESVELPQAAQDDGSTEEQPEETTAVAEEIAADEITAEIEDTSPEPCDEATPDDATDDADTDDSAEEAAEDVADQETT